jgi:hypothetical protein
MIIKNAEHLTRYTIFHEGKDYIRMIEKDVNGDTKMNWMTVEDGQIFVLGDTDSEKLELLFEGQIE